VTSGQFPDWAKSEGILVCVNNAKILCLENERRNTFLKQKQKPQSLSRLDADSCRLIYFGNAPIERFDAGVFVGVPSPTVGFPYRFSDISVGAS